MDKSKDYSWPTSPIKRSTKKQRKLKTLINKLDQAVLDDSSLSIEIRDLKNDIKELTSLE